MWRAEQRPLSWLLLAATWSGIGGFSVAYAADVNPSSSSTPAVSAAPPAQPCTGPEHRQLDFWIGDWDVSWPGQAGTPPGAGTNHVTGSLGGCVIEERFDGGGPNPLLGHSLSMYSTRLKKWQQTWVDNQGSYIDLVGGLENGELVLTSETTTPTGAKRLARMVFSSIQRDSFDWRWEGSTDAGKTWKVLWPIHYQRQRGVTLHLGDPAVDGSRIKPYRSSWRLTVRASDGQLQEQGIWTDEVVADRLGERAVLRRTQRVNGPKERTLIVNVFDPKTLEPISSDKGAMKEDGSLDVRNNRHRDFAFGEVRSRVTESAAAPGALQNVVENKARLSEPAFDFYGGMYGLVLAALPLREGYSGALPSVLEQKEQLGTVSFRVRERELVEAGGGHVLEAWVVEADTVFGKMTFWTIPEAPYVIKRVQELPGGAKWIWSMVEP